jgi:hypothetical protein
LTEINSKIKKIVLLKRVMLIYSGFVKVEAEGKVRIGG